MVSLTLRLEKMTYARWQPKKTQMRQSLPRPMPGSRNGDENKEKEKDKDKDKDDLKNVERLNQLIEESFYTEFFWFPNNGIDEGYWENCFKVIIIC